jgi:hypothetical protein
MNLDKNLSNLNIILMINHLKLPYQLKYFYLK